VRGTTKLNPLNLPNPSYPSRSLRPSVQTFITGSYRWCARTDRPRARFSAPAELRSSCKHYDGYSPLSRHEESSQPAPRPSTGAAQTRRGSCEGCVSASCEVSVCNKFLRDPDDRSPRFCSSVDRTVNHEETVFPGEAARRSDLLQVAESARIASSHDCSFYFYLYIVCRKCIKYLCQPCNKYLWIAIK